MVDKIFANKFAHSHILRYTACYVSVAMQFHANTQAGNSLSTFHIPDVCSTSAGGARVVPDDDLLIEAGHKSFPEADRSSRNVHGHGEDESADTLEYFRQVHFFFNCKFGIGFKTGFIFVPTLFVQQRKCSPVLKLISTTL